jgi:ketosteroid isomerase-like protein
MADRPSGAGVELVERVFGAGKSLDDYVSFFAEDALYRFANHPPIHGRAAIREAAANFRQRVRGVSHTVQGMWESGDTVVCEMEIAYTRLDGKETTVPCCDVFRVNGDKIQEMRIFVDVTPVFSQ